jgi:tetratricopeptide (TPR) repeat protein
MHDILTKSGCERLKKESRMHTFITVLGITVLAFLMLVSIVGATQSADAQNSGSNNYNDLNKVYEKDIKTQDEALRINPLDSDAWKSKGQDLHDLKRYDEAIITYDQAIQINPRDSDAWDGKGLALNQLRKYDEALRAFDKALEINPQDSIAWQAKGILSKPIK